MVAPHERTVIWQWARVTVAQPNRFGDVIKVLRKRHDMPHRFPHRRYMYEYLTGKAKVDPTMLSYVTPEGDPPLIDLLWQSYKAFVNKAMRVSSDDLTPEQLAAALGKTRAAS